MCWFLCANSIVNHWLHQGMDDACRKAQALKPLLAADLLEAATVFETEDVLIRSHVAAPASARLRMVLPADLFVVRGFHNRSWRALPQLRHKPFELLAHAWSRFLLWLGCR
jgi:hypothetical protein